MTPDELSATYPRLYHMAESGSWPSIEKHGLLSTEALVDLFEVPAAERTKLVSRHRPASVPIEHKKLGRAVVRDQRPMRDADLTRCLTDGMTPKAWYELLNSKVFFWLSEARLATLLGARAYRDRTHTVLTLDTRALVMDNVDKVWLAPMNTGCTRPMAHPRGEKTFQRLSEYPFHERMKRTKANAVVELAIDSGIYDVGRYVVEVRERNAGSRGRLIWQR